MDPLARQVLIDVVTRYRHSLVNDPRRLEALLRDLCGTARPEIAVLVTAARAGIPQDYRNRRQVYPSQRLLLEQMTVHLCDTCAIEATAARWAVESWSLALDAPVHSSSQSGAERPMYTAEISRRNPSCFLFLVDQSGSMSDPFGNSEVHTSKAQTLADAINRALDTLVGRCSKDEGVRRYFEIGVIGYGAAVGPVLGGALAGRDMVGIDEVADNPLRVEDRLQKIPDGMGGIVEVNNRLAIWFDPVANNGTPMCQALWRAHTLLEAWIDQHPEAFPPVVINITDGEANDGDPTPVSEAVRELATQDGNVLLLNLHLSSLRGVAPMHFPADENDLPDAFARLLFRMSSELPPHMLAAAQEKRYSVSDGARGMVFNADIADVVEFLDIGTRPANLR